MSTFQYPVSSNWFYMWMYTVGGGKIERNYIRNRVLVKKEISIVNTGWKLFFIPGLTVRDKKISYQPRAKPRVSTNHRQGTWYLLCFAFFWLGESWFSQLGLLKNHDNFTLWIGTRLWYKRTVCICESNILSRMKNVQFPERHCFQK